MTVYAKLENHTLLQKKEIKKTLIHYHFAKEIEHPNYDRVTFDMHLGKKDYCMIWTLSHEKNGQIDTLRQLSCFYPDNPLSRHFDKIPESIKEIILLSKEVLDQRERLRNLFKEGDLS